MSVSEIIKIITSVIKGIASVAKISRETLAKSLEQMASEVRAGKLIPDKLLADVTADGKKLDSIRDNLPE